MNIKKLVFVIAGVLAVAATASAGDSNMQVPRVERGKLVTPAPTVPVKYPRVDGPQGDRRLYLNKDVSIAGGLAPPSANVRVPFPKK